MKEFANGNKMYETANLLRLLIRYTLKAINSKRKVNQVRCEGALIKVRTAAITRITTKKVVSILVFIGSDRSICPSKYSPLLKTFTLSFCLFFTS